MTIYEILETKVIVFADKESDILLAWNGQIEFEVYAGRFDGNYDSIDSFYREVSSVITAKEVAKLWFQEHSTFNPGP